MTKRIISVLLSITLILTSFATIGFAADGIKLGFGTESVEGDVVKVPVTLSSLPETLDTLSSLTVNYEYDTEKLSYSGVEQGLLGVNSDNAVDGRVSWYQANSSITSVDNDVLFTIVFSKKADAEHDADIEFTYGQITSDTAIYKETDGLVLGSTTVDLGDLPDAEFSLSYYVDEETKKLEVPVYIDSLPEKLSDISALTLKYEYDTEKLTYAGVKSGAIDLGTDGVFDSAGVVAWYSTEAVTDVADELFTLVFDIKSGAEGQARIALIFAEAADSNYKFTQLLTLNKVMADIPAFDEEPKATVSLGDAVIDGRDIKIPVVLDTLPTDITGLSSVDVRYTFDTASLTYVGVESGAITVDNSQHVSGHVSWYSADLYTEEIENTTLFYILLQANYDVQGDTTVAITSTELADTDSTSALVDKTDVTFSLPTVPAPVLPAEVYYGNVIVSEDATVEVPVFLDKLPVGLSDITAFKFVYDYDTTMLEYVKTESGVMETGVDYATAGTVSWYSTEAVTDVADELFTLVFKIKGGAEGVAKINGTFVEAADSTYNVTTDITLNEVSFDVTDYAPAEEAQIVIQPEVTGREVKVPVVLNVLPTDLTDLASIIIEYSYNEEELKLVGIEGGLVDAVINEDGSIEWTAAEGEALENIDDDVLFILIFEVQYESTGTAEIVITDVTLADSANTVSANVGVDTEESGDVQLPEIAAPAIRELTPSMQDVIIPYEIATAADSDTAIRNYLKSIGFVVIVVYVNGEQRDVTSLAEFSVDPVTFKLSIAFKNANCEVGMEKEPKTEVAKESVRIVTREDGKRISRIPLKLNKIPMILGKVSRIVISAQVADATKATLSIVSDYFTVTYEDGKYILTPAVSTFSLRRSATTGGLTEGEDIEFANIELDPTCAQTAPATVNVGAMELYNDDGESITIDAMDAFDAELPFIEHTWGDWVETLAPTVTTAGTKERTCGACGEPQTEEIPKLIGLESLTATPDSITVPYDVWSADDKIAAIKNHIARLIELGDVQVTATLEDDTTFDVTGTAFENVAVDTDALTATFSYTHLEQTQTAVIALEPVLIDSFVSVAPITVPYGTENVEAYVVEAIGDVKGTCSDGSEITLDPSEYTITYADGVATITLNFDTSIKLDITVTQITIVSVASDLASVSISHANWFNKTASEIADYIKSVAGYKITATLSDTSTLDVTATATVTVDTINNKAVVTADGATVEIALTFLAYGQEEGSSDNQNGGSTPPRRPVTGNGAGIVITPAEPEVDNRIFIDLSESHYAYDAIMNLYERGIISGDGSKRVYPENGITREEIAKTALGIASIPVDSSLTIDAPDKDAVSDWAKGYVATAIKEGILTGYEDGTIKPKNVITRGEMVAIIVRLLGIQVEGAEASFKDVDESLWSAPYIAAASELGFINGYEDGTFRPERNITRAEAFTIYSRVLKFTDALKAAAGN